MCILVQYRCQQTIVLRSIQGRCTAAHAVQCAATPSHKRALQHAKPAQPAKLCARQVEAETDELLLLDEDMLDVDPEQLPRRLLSDFSIYNAEACTRAHACTLLQLPAT